MIPCRVVFLAFLAGTGVLPAAAPPQEAAHTTAAAPEPTTEALISDLASDDYKVREKATLKLWTRGETVLEDLKKAAGGEDPEVAFRTSKLIRDIEHFITPDTDPELIEQVESYKKANADDKVDIFRKIAMKRGWHQILKLYAAETDATVRENLRDQAYGAAIIGAREKIVAKKNDEARRFLELAPRDDRSLVALACFHRANGTLEEERGKAAGGSADWRAALARAAGDTVAAAAAAQEAGDERLTAAMKLFNGEFLPWLDLMKKTEENPSRKLYMDIVAASWDPKHAEAGKEALTQLFKEVTDSRDDENRTRAAAILFLAGYPALAEPALAKAPLLDAVDYHSTVEHYSEAISAFGLDPETPDFKGWVEKKFTVYLNQRRFENDRIQDESSEAEKELKRLIQLLGQLGLESEMLSAFEKPLLSMAETDQDDFLTLLTALFSESGSGSNTLAQAVGGKWAGDDEARWRQLANLAFNEDETAIQWWEWTAVLDPKASLADRFEGLLGLFNSIPDPKQTRTRWLDLAWKAVEKATPAQKAQYLRRIGYTSDFSRTEGRSADMDTSLKVLAMQAPEDESSPLQTQSFLGLSIRGEWQQVVDIFKEMIAGAKDEEVAVSRPELHAYLAASLRRAGREEEAAAHDQWVDKLAPGDPGASVKISNGYAFGGDQKRASVWLARYAMETSPSLDSYEDVFNEYSVHLLEKGRWKESAALAEAMALRASEIDAQLSQAPFLMNIRLKAELPHALALLETDRPRAMEMLGRCHAFFPGGGLLADYFFPALRKAGLMKEHDEYFASSWKVMSALTKRYPRSEQTLNGSAWLAARAVSRLPEAEALSRKALELNPDQAAYLDTFAEIQFAKKDRKAAVKWSSRAVNFAPGDAMIRRQYERFSTDPFPED